MLNAYKYLYTRIYLWNLRMWGENDIPHLNSLLGVTFLVFLNIYFIFILCGFIFSFKAISIFNSTNIFPIVSYLVILAINYFVLIWKDEYKILRKKYENETEAERNRKYWFCLYYVVASFILPIFIILITS